MVEQNGGTNAPDNSGTIHAKTGGGGRGTEDLCGDTCRELLYGSLPEVKRHEAAELTEPFGEWQIRHEQKIRVNLLGVTPCCNRVG